MTSRQDRGYWMGWIVAAGIAVAFLGTIAIYMFLTNAFCTGVSGEHCVREWVSALGAWVALLAAIPTVAILFRQVRDAKQHHLDNAMLSLRRRRSICERVLNIADEYSEYIKGSERNWTESRTSYVDMKTAAGIELHLLESVVDRTTFENFEAEIEIPIVSAGRLLERVQSIRSAIERPSNDGDYQELLEIHHRMASLYEMADSLFNDASAKARTFISDTNHLTEARLEFE